MYLRQCLVVHINYSPSYNFYTINTFLQVLQKQIKHYRRIHSSSYIPGVLVLLHGSTHVHQMVRLLRQHRR